MSTRSGAAVFRIPLAAALLALLAGCDLLEQGLARQTLPTVAQVDSIYSAGDAPPDSVRISGNIVEVHYDQPIDQLRRGGSLWARVGPYIYLFSPATRALMERFEDVGAVRVITVASDGTEIARALLPRSGMSEIRWRRSLNLLGHALQEGSRRPTRLEDLVQWGERNTTYEYNRRFTQ